jgi:hypothetical protein
MADQELTIKISAKNLTGDEFAKARKEIAGLNDEVEKSNGGADKASKGWTLFGQSVVITAGDIFRAGGVVKDAIFGIVGGIIELGKRGSEINDVRENFDLLNKSIGLNGSQSMKTLQTAVDGMIPKFELMKMTNQALSQGMKVTDGDFKTLGEGARVLAERIGGSTAEAYRVLTDAMASGKTMQLKGIGLNIDEKATIEALARARGVDASELNEHDQKMAKSSAVIAELTRVLKEGGRATMDFGDTFEQASAKLQDWKDDLASGVASSKVLGAALESVGDILQAVFGGNTTDDAIKNIVKAIEQGAIYMVEFGRVCVTAGDIIARVFSGAQAVFDGVAGAIAQLASWFARLLQGIGAVGQYLPGVGVNFEALKNSSKEMATWLDGAAKGFFQVGGAAVQSSIGVRDQNDMFVRLDGALARVQGKMVAASTATDTNTGAVKTNIGAINDHGQALAAADKALDAYNKKVNELSKALTEASRNGASIESVMKLYGNGIKDLVAEAEVRGKQLPEVIKQAFLKMTLKEAGDNMKKELDRIMKDQEEFLKKRTEAINKAIIENLKIADESYKDAQDRRNKRSMNDLDYAKSVIEREAKAKQDALDKTVFGYDQAMQAIADDTREKMQDAEQSYAQSLANMQAETEKWADGVTSDLLKAFSGGKFGDGLKGAFSGIFGQVGAGAMDSLNYYVKQGLVKTQDFFSKFQPTSNKGMAAMGGLGVGLDMAQGLIGEPNTKGKQVASSAITGAKYGMIAGPWGAAIGAGVGAVVGMFKEDPVYTQGKKDVAAFQDLLSKSLTKTQLLETGNVGWKNSVVAVRDAYLKAGKSAAEAEGVVKNLWDSKNPEKYKKAMEEIQNVMNDNAQDQQDLNDAISEYGFTVDQLGPKMRKQQLTEQAVKLENQYRLLVESGIDNNLVIEKMAGNMNNYINTSIKAGEAIPSEMKPIIQKMIEMGQLTDENGNKVTSLAGSGITFSETMTQGFDRVVKALNKLVSTMGGVPDALDEGTSAANGLAGAIAAIPSDKRIRVTTEYQSEGQPDSQGGEVPGFATEAYVRKPTLAMVGDTPGGELIVKPETVKNWINAASGAAAASAAANASAGSGGGSVNVNINTVAADAEQIRRLVYSEIGPRILDWLQNNKGTSQTDLKQILGS